MAMSSNVYLTAAYGSPFPQNRNSERVKHILKEFKPTPASTRNWSISQNETLVSGPLKHRRTINTVSIYMDYDLVIVFIKESLTKCLSDFSLKKMLALM